MRSYKSTIRFSNKSEFIFFVSQKNWIEIKKSTSLKTTLKKLQVNADNKYEKEKCLEKPCYTTHFEL